MKRQPELVLLVEPDGANVNGKLRALEIYAPARMFIENCALDPLDPKNPAKQWVRTWICRNDERALSGQRVFREELPPVPEEKENPLYDEREVKIKLGVDGATMAKMVKKHGRAK